MKTNKYNFVNLQENDSELYEYCKENGWLSENATPENFDCLSFFEGDPDIIKVEKEEGYFFKTGKTIFYWLDTFHASTAENMLTDFFNAFETGVTLGCESYLRGNNPKGVKDMNTWQEWNTCKNGIAYRGGAGYCYALFNFEEWAKAKTA